MNERPFGHASGHSRHDRLLVGRFATGDTTGAETVEGRNLVEQCQDCAALAADIKQLRASLAALPDARRTRNFRLTTEDAERLRGSAFDRFLRRLSMPSLGFVRPLAGVALALGLTITVVGGGLPASYLPRAASAPAATEADRLNAVGAPTRDNSAGAAADATAQEFATNAPVMEGAPSVPGATSATEQKVTSDAAGTASPKATEPAIAAPPDEPTPTTAADDQSTDTTRLLLIYGGVTLAMLAFAVLLLTVYARRRTEDPLLR